MKNRYLSSYSFFKPNRNYTISVIENILQDIKSGQRRYICSSIMYHYGYGNKHKMNINDIYDFIEFWYYRIYKTHAIHSDYGIFGRVDNNDNMVKRKHFLQEILIQLRDKKRRI